MTRDEVFAYKLRRNGKKMILPAYIIEEISKRKTGKHSLEELLIELPEGAEHWLPESERDEEDSSDERGVAIIDFSI